MKGWHKFNRETPCPICGNKDACRLSPDKTVVLCIRQEQGCMKRRDGSAVQARNGMGWFHRIGESKGGGRNPSRQRDEHLTASECELMQRRFVSELTESILRDLNFDLGISVQTLRKFDVGFSHEHRAWTFPMRDGQRRICGFRTRDKTGAKRAVRGSASGLFIPSDYESFQLPEWIGADDFPLLLLLPEGPTDAAAAVDLGLRAIGRPSNMGGADQLHDLLRRERDRQEVVIVADSDPVKWLHDGTPFVPGWEGALSLANKIVDVCGTLKILRPPGDQKDLRKWFRNGGRPNVLAALIAEAEVMTREILDNKIRRITEWKIAGRNSRNKQAG